MKPKIEQTKGWFDRLSEVVDVTKPVEIYRNLHKHCFSVRQNGIVAAHVDYIVLSDCTFKVSQAGRKRVLETQKKNVHAVIRGLPVSSQFVNQATKPEDEWLEVTYNPYKYDAFVVKGSEFKVHKAKFVDAMINQSVLAFQPG